MPRRYFRASSLLKYMEHYTDKRDDGHWIWTGPKTENGRGGAEHWYGVVRYGRLRERAHRVSWEIHRGPIPPDKQLDHLCRITLCINPDCLEPVTNRENTTRGDGPRLTREIRLAWTHCKRGHPLSGDNLGKSSKQRVCKKCKALRQQQYNAAKRG